MHPSEGRRRLLLSSINMRSITALAAVLLFGLSFDVQAHAGNGSRIKRRPAIMKANRAASLAAREGGCVRCGGGPRAKRVLNARASSFNDSPCHAKGYVDPKVAKNFNAAMRDLNRQGIRPKVTSAWRSSEKQASLYRCSGNRRCRRANPGLYRALPPGQSLHEAGLAVDISGIAAGPRGAKRVTPRGRRIISAMNRNGFRWRYGLKDPAHFEANPRSYGYRNAKQAISRSQNICDARVQTVVDKRPGRSRFTPAAIRRQAPARRMPVQISTVKTRKRSNRA
jgi:hypothetical protein